MKNTSFDRLVRHHSLTRDIFYTANIPTEWKPLPDENPYPKSLAQKSKYPNSHTNIPYLPYQNTLPSTLQIHSSLTLHLHTTLTFSYSNEYKRISYQNTTKTLTFVTLFITLLHFKHSFLTNETLNSHRNHIYIIFTYISTNKRIFITIYNQIRIKQHTLKNTIKIRLYTQP